MSKEEKIMDLVAIEAEIKEAERKLVLIDFMGKVKWLIIMILQFLVSFLI